MAYSALPPTLLDLTLVGLSSASPARLTRSVGGAIRWQRASSWHRNYQTTTNATPSPENGDGIMSIEKLSSFGRRKGSLVVRSRDSARTSSPIHPLEDLERRVQALDETTDARDNSAAQPFFYAEEDLLAIYKDVLEVSIPQTSENNDEAASKAVRLAEAREDQHILEALQHRLLDDVPSTSTSHRGAPVYRRILLRAHEIFLRVEAARNAVNPEGSPNYVPLGLLSIREFEALARESKKARDIRAAEVVLDMMKREKVSLFPSAATNFLQIYAASGDIKATDELLANFLKESPTEAQRHLHIQAHINGTPKDIIPTSAMELLHHYEEKNLAAPMQTYTTVIKSLFSRPSSLARAQAWDIFTHMRYAAHPNPDAVLYALMIRACASPVSIRYSSEPEKALDLWTEMTVDHKLTPSVDAYNAVILACARSGTKIYVNEAFRLARQMLDSHRDAYGFSAFKPDRKTFCALLEGVKRVGDLGRARWILAELVRESQHDDPNAVTTEINDEIMMHIFNAYASYKPLFVREATNIVDGQSQVKTTSTTEISVVQEASAVKDHSTDIPEGSAQSPEASSSDGVSPSTISPVVEDSYAYSSFSQVPPQSRTEVIHEVKILFTRILLERRGARSTATAPLPFTKTKFHGVEITSRLLGAYLSVFYKHASLEICSELFWKMADDFSTAMSPRLYLEALERCGNARRGHERQIAVPCAEQLWAKWTVLEDSADRQGKPLQARMVERAHIALIRVLTVTENVDRAMTHLRQFAEKYPPNTIRTPSPKPAFRSSRSALVGHCPLVRMTSAAEVPDDNVPPLVTFRDVEVLHHRLIDDARVKDIGYVTWLCKAYEWALRVRRDEAMKAKIAAPDKAVTV